MIKSFLLFSFLAVCLAAAFTYCNSETWNKQVQTTDTCAAPADINPNKSSELAVLMRKMHEHAKQTKSNIEQNATIGNFPEEFLKITTDTPTDEHTKLASFEGYAAHYLNSIKNLYENESLPLRERHNAVVNSCLSCHSEHCGGPVPAIKKLIMD